MGLFRKKRTKIPENDDMTIVDEVKYTEETIRRQQVTRATGYTCPVCSNILFNMKLDGFHYYCPECTKQYNIKDLKK